VTKIGLSASLCAQFEYLPDFHFVFYFVFFDDTGNYLCIIDLSDDGFLYLWQKDNVKTLDPWRDD